MVKLAAPLILIDDWLPGEIRAFALDGEGRLVDCLVLRDSRPVLTGAVFLGRVASLDRGLKAAFLDLGLDRPGFLPLKTAPEISEGDRLVVRVTREASAGKGPRLAPMPDSTTAIDATAPALLRPAEPLLDWLDALTGIKRIIAATPALRHSLARSRPELAARIEAPRDPLGIVEASLEERFQALLQPIVPLPRGGAIRIDALPSLVAVDVDSGGRDGRGGPDALALDCDLAAAAVLARESRLRSLSGLVVVDFLELETKAGRRSVEEALRAAFEADPAKGQVEPMRASGLVELTRRRLRPSLLETLAEPCGLGGGGWRLTAESEALVALRASLAAALRSPASRPVLGVTPEMRAALERVAAPARRAVEARLGGPLDLRPLSDEEAPWAEVYAWRLSMETAT